MAESAAERMREMAAARAGAEATLCRQARDECLPGAMRTQWQFAFSAAKTIQSDIASIPLPADPRDDEIAALREALEKLVNSAADPHTFFPALASARAALNPTR